MRLVAAILVVVLLSVLLPAPVGAAVKATVEGKVLDLDGNPIPGVRVTIFSNEYDFKTEAVTKKKGRYSLVVLDASRAHSIRVEKEGYQSVEQALVVTVGETVTQTWTLPPVDDPGGIGNRGIGPPSQSRAATDLFRQGIERFREGDFEGAVVKLEQALVEDSEMADAYAALSVLYLRQGRTEEAVTTADRALALDAGNIAALESRCDALQKLDRHTEAEATVDALVAVERSPTNAARVFNLGVAKSRAGDLEGAAARFRQAIDLAPDLAPAWGALGTMYLQLEQYEEALAAADKLLELDPGNAKAYTLRFDAYQALGLAAEADEAFEELQTVSPGAGADAFMDQGRNAFNTGDMEQAKAAVGRALEAAPDLPEAHFIMGLAGANSGDNQLALEHLSRFLELAPDSPDAETARQMLEYIR